MFKMMQNIWMSKLEQNTAQCQCLETCSYASIARDLQNEIIVEGIEKKPVACVGVQPILNCTKLKKQATCIE
jgi:hypothetical protein